MKETRRKGRASLNKYKYCNLRVNIPRISEITKNSFLIAHGDILLFLIPQNCPYILIFKMDTSSGSTTKNPRRAGRPLQFTTLEEKAQARRERNQRYLAKVKRRNVELGANMEESILESSSQRENEQLGANIEESIPESSFRRENTHLKSPSPIAFARFIQAGINPMDIGEATRENLIAKEQERCKFL